MDSQTNTEMMIENLLCAVLRGRSPAWPWEADDVASQTAFRRAANQHRVEPLIHHLLSKSDTVESWPVPVLRGLRQAYFQESAFQLRRDEELMQIWQQANRQSIDVLFFKGMALGHVVYEHPSLRTSGDTDILIHRRSVTRFTRIMCSLGYDEPFVYRGPFHTNATVFRKTLGDALIEFDCHWEVNNRPLFASMFSFDELVENSIDSPVLKGWRLPNRAYLALLACLHRTGHRNINSLLWTFDIHLLANKMTDQERTMLYALARQKQLQSVCEDGFRSASEMFPNERSREIAAELLAGVRESASEPSAVYVRERRTELGDALIRWQTLPSVSAKLAYIGELLFPSVRYLRWKYRRAGRWWLPILYTRNFGELVAGGLKLSLSFFHAGACQNCG